MKKLFLCALTALAFLGAKAQDAQNTIKINPLSALLSTGSVFYERKINDGISAQLGLAYTGIKLEDVKFTGVAITPEVRFYLKQKAISGLYAAPFLRYQNYTVTDGTDKGKYNSFGGGALIGRQWVYGSGFVLDLFFGPSYNSGTYKATQGNNEPDIKGGIEGFGIRTGIALGFGF
ncbi:hypothetical protein DHW03_13020 [Pedobacter yonginense]|uniref:DUF3575 domain-containing protein n=1 Tax=Pedobacter yonginense TaxID=651869 RepID=A0A317EPB8_9SPHI|nr:DUF3575 domain-containing protein [Pedobacter yonginense]PWS26938.1 hypothetical protein DHW03_13020 [Pedobacter yonginense]